jgi:hypothetical protein
MLDDARQWMQFRLQRPVTSQAIHFGMNSSLVKVNPFERVKIYIITQRKRTPGGERNVPPDPTGTMRRFVPWFLHLILALPAVSLAGEARKGELLAAQEEARREAARREAAALRERLLQLEARRDDLSSRIASAEQASLAE